MKPENTRVKVNIMENKSVYFGDVQLPIRVMPGGLEFYVKEFWLRHEYGERIVLTWDEIDRLRGVPGT